MYEGVDERDPRYAKVLTATGRRQEARCVVAVVRDEFMDEVIRASSQESCGLQPSSWCYSELKWAVDMQKPVVVVLWPNTRFVRGLPLRAHLDVGVWLAGRQTIRGCISTVCVFRYVLLTLNIYSCLRMANVMNCFVPTRDTFVMCSDR